MKRAEMNAEAVEQDTGRHEPPGEALHEFQEVRHPQGIAQQPGLDRSDIDRVGSAHIAPGTAPHERYRRGIGTRRWIDPDKAHGYGPGDATTRHDSLRLPHNARVLAFRACLADALDPAGCRA
ncbi:MAG: hypothetical protein O2825_00340 [Proteobacteria bacterium]|nr:hypothetical protein [Pseudomonadota bacterium]